MKRMPKAPLNDARARLMEMVLVVNGCWEWQGTKHQYGYGVITFKRKRWLAHRLAYDTFVGVIPAGMFVMHLCDNRGCCNPGHLTIGTHVDNMNDAKAKGRMAHGERNGRAKLTIEQVNAIRDRRKRGDTLASIALDFGIRYQQVSRIILGQRWSARGEK